MSKVRTVLAVVTVSAEEIYKSPNFIQPIPTLDCVRRLLFLSWRDIGFQYEGLTNQEKDCITKEQHAMLLPWVITAYEGENNF